MQSLPFLAVPEIVYDRDVLLAVVAVAFILCLKRESLQGDNLLGGNFLPDVEAAAVANCCETVDGRTTRIDHRSGLPEGARKIQEVIEPDDQRVLIKDFLRVGIPYEFARVGRVLEQCSGVDDVGHFCLGHRSDLLDHLRSHRLRSDRDDVAILCNVDTGKRFPEQMHADFAKQGLVPLCAEWSVIHIARAMFATGVDEMSVREHFSHLVSVMHDISE